MIFGSLIIGQYWSHDSEFPAPIHLSLFHADDFVFAMTRKEFCADASVLTVPTPLPLHSMHVPEQDTLSNGLFII